MGCILGVQKQAAILLKIVADQDHKHRGECFMKNSTLKKLALTLCVLPSVVTAYPVVDSSGMKVVRENSISTTYRYKNWEIISANKASEDGYDFYNVNIISDFKFKNHMGSPLEMKIHCKTGQVYFEISAIRDLLSTEPPSYFQLSPVASSYVAALYFDEKGEFVLSLNKSLTGFSGENLYSESLIRNIINSKKLKVVSAVKSGDEYIWQSQDTFQLDGAEKVLAAVTKNCTPSKMLDL